MPTQVNIKPATRHFVRNEVKFEFETNALFSGAGRIQDFRIEVRINVARSNDSSNYNEYVAAILQLIPSDDQKASCDISELIEGEVRNIIGNAVWQEAVAGSNPYFVLDNYRSYTIDYREYLNGGREPWETIPTRFWAYLGGIDEGVFADGYRPFQEFNIDYCILSSFPTVRTTDLYCPQFLTVVNWLERRESFWISIGISYTDGTGATVLRHQFVAPEAWDFLCFRVDPQTLFLENENPGKTIQKYQVTIFYKDINDAAIAASPTYIFFVDDFHRESKRYLLYFNAYQVPEGAYFRGNFEEQNEVTRLLSQKAGLSSYQDAEEQQTNRTVQKIFTYRSGYVSEQERRALAELEVEDYVFDVTEQVGKMAIRIDESSFDISRTLQVLYAVSFSAKRAQNLTSLIMPDRSLSVWAQSTMNEYMLIHHLDSRTGAVVEGREFDEGFQGYIVDTLLRIAYERDANGVFMRERPAEFMAKSFYAFHTTETTWTIWNPSMAKFSTVDLGWEWNGQILLDKLVPRALSGRFGLCWDRHGNAISLGGHFPNLGSIETARNNYNEKPFRGTLPKIKYYNNTNFKLVRLHRTGEFSGRYEDNASANVKSYYLRSNKLNYIPFYVIDRVRVYFYVSNNSLSYEALKLIIETLHTNRFLLSSDGSGVLALANNAGNQDVLNDANLMQKLNEIAADANWSYSL